MVPEVFGVLFASTMVLRNQDKKCGAIRRSGYFCDVMTSGDGRAVTGPRSSENRSVMSALAKSSGANARVPPRISTARNERCYPHRLRSLLTFVPHQDHLSRQAGGCFTTELAPV